MQFSTYFFLAAFYSVISVLGMGLVLTSWLDRFHQTDASLSRPHLLLSLSVGLYWTTFVFIGLFIAKVPLSSIIVKRVLLIDFGLIVLSFGINRYQTQRLFTAIARDSTTLAISFGGTLLGVWAMLRFPHVLDSGQILWTQRLLNGNLGQPISAMMGFSALVGMFGALFPASPVVTTAAAFKPMLLGLYGCLAVTLGSIIAPRHRVILALGFVVLSIPSAFGAYGLLETGKDSMWGMLFAMAFFGTLCRSDAGRRGVELAFYFTTAATLGVITLPYMAIAYALWLLVGAPEDRAADTLPALMLISVPILPTVLAGFLGISIGPVYLAYLVLTAGVLGCHQVGATRAAVTFLSHLARPVRSFVPLSFAVAAFLLFPVALAFPVWINADGSVVTETRAPLDGVTSFLDYLMAYPVQNVTVGLGLIASLLIGFTAYGRRTPGLLAIASMPLVSLTLALVRAHLPIHVIDDFNVWDIVKDIPQWFGGTLLAFVLLALVAAIGENRGGIWFFYPVLAIVVGTCGYVSLQRTSFAYYTKPVSYRDYAASADPVMAEVANLAWSRLKGMTLWVDPQLPVSKQYFYSFQMYDARSSVYDPSKIANALEVGGSEMGFLVSNRELARIKRAVETQNGSIDYLASLESENASLLLVRMDGRQKDALPASIDRALVASGQYDREISGHNSFNWMRAKATIAIAAPNITTGCVSMSLFDAGLRSSPQIATVTDEQGYTSSVDVANHTLAAPAILRQTVRVADGEAKLDVSEAAGEGSFPNDARKIAYGLILPIKLTDGPCSEISPSLTDK